MRSSLIKGGITRKILRVDLSSRKIWLEETERYARDWIGGRAVNSFILLEESPPGTKWSDPENLLIFGAGALVGSPTPGACRTSIETKNVFNNGKGSANVGGFFGAELKYAGFDHLIITGKSEVPLYLFLHQGKGELKEASFLWGKTVSETEELLIKEFYPLNIRVATIGPAGENKVKGAAIVCDRAKVAGGSGVGCVMGDKKLKAIVVAGETGKIKLARPESFFKALDTALKKVRDSPLSEMMRRKTLAGRWCDLQSSNWDFLISSRNGQDDYWDVEKRRKLTHPEFGFPKYRKRISACFMCPIGCIPFSEIKEGPYAGTRGEGFWSNSIMDAARLDITDPEGIIHAWILSNELGLDTDFATGVCAWAFECYEKGLITKKDTDGLELIWGKVDSYITLLRKIAYREGIGDLLAYGSKEASKILGKGSEKFAVHVKGQDSIEPFRIPKGWALAVCTSPVAGRHLRGSVLDGSRFGPKYAFFEAHTYEDKAKYVFWQSMTKEMEDMLGICVYVGTWSGAYALEPSDYVNLTNSVMGTDFDEKSFFYLAQRSYNLEKAFNTIHTDFDRKDDYPPERFMEEEVQSGPFKGSRCDKENWDRMLDEFYELHGWEKKSGLQTRSILIKLNLEFIIEKLRRVGKLIES